MSKREWHSSQCQLIGDPTKINPKCTCPEGPVVEEDSIHTFTFNGDLDRNTIEAAFKDFLDHLFAE